MLKQQEFPVLNFPAGRQPHLVGRRRLPKRKDAARRINRCRLGVYSVSIQQPKMEILVEGKLQEEKVCFT